MSLRGRVVALYAPPLVLAMTFPIPHLYPRACPAFPVKFRPANGTGGFRGMSETTTPRSRTGLVIWMIVSQLLTVGSLVIWLLVAGLSVMAFELGRHGGGLDGGHRGLVLPHHSADPRHRRVDRLRTAKEPDGGGPFGPLLRSALPADVHRLGRQYDLVHPESQRILTARVIQNVPKA